jgi:hypothetical protein
MMTAGVGGVNPAARGQGSRSCGISVGSVGDEDGGGDQVANFCEHCEGQRFDRAQVLRLLRQVRRELRGQKCGKKVDDALVLALKSVARMDIPHLEIEPYTNGDVVH